MSVSGGPTIIKDGLVLCLDAADDSSYVSGSNTWYDLSGNNNSGSLINGPTFDSGSKGSILFDSTNDAVNCGSDSSLDFGTTFSYQFWINPNTIGYQPIIYRFGSIGYYIQLYPSDQIAMYCKRPTAGDASFNAVDRCVNIGVWQNIAISFYIWQVLPGYLLGDVYKNGKYVSALTTVTPPSQAVNMYIGNNKTFNTGFDGKISQIMAYNRTLSAAEILQNYNATKGRYNL